MVQWSREKTHSHEYGDYEQHDWMVPLKGHKNENKIENQNAYVVNNNHKHNFRIIISLISHHTQS